MRLRLDAFENRSTAWQLLVAEQAMCTSRDERLAQPAGTASSGCAPSFAKRLTRNMHWNVMDHRVGCRHGLDAASPDGTVAFRVGGSSDA